MLSEGKRNHGVNILVVQCLRLHVSNAGGLVSIPVQGTGSHMLQLKIPQPATKTKSNQIKNFFKLLKTLWKTSSKKKKNEDLDTRPLDSRSILCILCHVD